VIRKWKKNTKLTINSSKQDLASRGKDDHEKGEGTTQNYTGGAC